MLILVKERPVEKQIHLPMAGESVSRESLGRQVDNMSENVNNTSLATQQLRVWPRSKGMTRHVPPKPIEPLFNFMRRQKRPKDSKTVGSVSKLWDFVLK